KACPRSNRYKFSSSSSVTHQARDRNTNSPCRQYLVLKMRFRKEFLFRVLLAAGILTFSLLYLLAVRGYWKITPDSITYVMAAESIAAGNGYTIQGNPVPVVSPGTSLVFSLGFLLFPGSYLALNFIVAVLTLCSLFFAFILFKSATETN